ncbi:MAG: phenylalanine--tRNA ligase subunit alpha [Candidatus Hydrothermarchaeota archaeon]
MSLDERISELHIFERKVLVELGRLKKSTPDELSKKVDLDKTAINRAIEWLRRKNLIKVHEKERIKANIKEEGKKYLKEGFPERKLLKYDEKPISEIHIDKEDLKIGLGWIRKKGWGEIKKRDGKAFLELTEEGKKFKDKLGRDEEILRGILDGKTYEGEKLLIKELEKRGLIEVIEIKERILELTEKGEELISFGIPLEEEVTQLTSEIITSGKWKEVKFRRYDITASVPKVSIGKKHPLRRLIDEIREIFLLMGFVEVRGPLVESAFWNFDALFQPQDHPAREMQDTFYLKRPERAKLPKDLVKNVKEAHEHGGKTGSIGWGGEWKEDIASKTLLRTHNTSLSVRYLHKHKEPPVRMFAVDRVFRRENITYKHLPEFHQVEGIAMDKNSNFAQLLGILRKFYKAMGFEQIRIRPGYFPYTEPSLEVEVFYEEKGEWVELGGAGIFRPELLDPLGVKYPVLAWGLGLERLAMMKLDIDDIRLLYRGDIEWLKKIPLR